MLLGGLIGGIAGARWHTKLERDALADHDAKSIDLREGRTTTNDTRTVAPAAAAPAVAAPTRTTGTDATTANEAATIDHREPIHTRPAGDSTR
jgi:hypothetical protein